jgi:phosphoribosylanthranilate isomerase
MTPLIKICGLSTPETLAAAVEAGADLVGFVHFPKSPRHVDLETGRALAAGARGRALKVALLVDPDDATLAAAVAAFDPDLIQLHGAESPQRVAAVRTRFGRPVMKALGIADEADLAGLDRYRAVADRLLLDAKPPKTAEALPGGNGIAFDWRLVAGLDAAGLDPATSFMLSGGLNPGNVGTAIALTGARSVDVSSGVEVRPGEKDPAQIEAFVRAARAAWAGRGEPPQA